MKLASTSVGSGSHISFVHGFTQTRQSWQQVISELSSFTSTSFDAPGHGKSEEGKRSLVECGDDIAESMSVGALVGYSMGARMALHTALQHPEKVERLVLVSGTAGIDDATERAQRRARDNELADHIEEVGVEKFIAEWLSNSMFAGLTTDAAQIPYRLQNSAIGLADSLRYAGAGTQSPLWESLSTLKMPVLIVVGELDTKFTQLGERMHAQIDNSEYVVVPNSGHTVHLENHRAFTETLRNFLL